MKKDKLSFIVYKYSFDTGFLALIVISIALCIFLIFGIFESLLFLIPISAIVIFNLYMIIKILIIKNKVSKNDLESIDLTNAQAYIKETKETTRCGAILIKLYIIDENKKKYNYYYLTGSEVKFKEYKNTINNGEKVTLFLYKGTNVISNIIVDGEELKDLYYEIKYSKKLRKPIVYSHIKYKRTKKAIYKYEEYDINDVKDVFEKAKLYEELFIINKEDKYVKISYNQETHNEFLIDKNKFNTFEELLHELEKNGFVFEGKLRVIYTLGNTDPTSFNMLINEVK